MTPEFEKALQLSEQKQFIHLAGTLATVKTSERNRHAAKGTLRSGLYLEDLAAGLLAALATNGEALGDAYLRLAKRADLLGRDDAEDWLVARLERLMSAKGLVHSLEEESRFLKVDGFAKEAERRVQAVRSQAALRLRGLIAEERLGHKPATAERGEGGMATNPRRVAVVHGRNDPARDAVFTFLRSLGLSPVEWEQAVRETGRGTPYNREVVEQLFVSTQAVVVVLTGDEDVVLREPLRRKPEDGSTRRSSRANVYFEAGRAFALQPDRTVLVEVGPHDVPSDLHGLNAVRLDGSAESRHALRGRLATAGCAVEDSGSDWLSAGADQLKRALDL